MTEHILVTGWAGFIGSNFIYYYLEEHPDRTLIGLDKLTYAGNLVNLSKIPGHQKDRFHFIRGDVCDAENVERAFRDFDIDGVIHFAAESHVDRSIIDPQVFLKSNILGTFVLLDAARKFWPVGKDDPGSHRFVHCRVDQLHAPAQRAGVVHCQCYGPACLSPARHCP